jgi:opacity protein-like surface antigen
MQKILVYLLVCFTTALYSQTFTGGICGGITTSQINNDDVGGFYKFGPTGGFFIQKKLQEFTALQYEIRYTAKGSSDGAGGLQINLGYIETPLLCKYSKHIPFTFYGGLSPAIKLFETTSHSMVLRETNDFSRFELPFAVGISYNLTSTMYADVRYTQSTVSAGGVHYWYLNQCLYFAVYKNL